MIFQAREVSRKGIKSKPYDAYPVYNIYADGDYIGPAICRHDDMWFVPWPMLECLVGRRHFRSLKDAARHIYVAREKQPEKHRAWVLQISMHFPDGENGMLEVNGIEDYQAAMKLLAALRKHVESTGKRRISLDNMFKISDMTKSRVEKGVRALVERGFLTPRVGRGDYDINIRSKSRVKKRLFDFA